MRLFLAALVLVGAMTVARADDDPMAFARAGMGVHAVERVTAPPAHPAHVGAPMRLSGAVPDMIAAHVAARMGPQWVPAVLRIARIESGFRCAAYNRGHYGLFQVGDPRAFGVSPRQAMTCGGGIAVGVAYLQRCLRMGARTAAMLEACENSGSPYTARRHLERAYRVAGL